MMVKDCPCTKDCPDRSPSFCPKCPKGIEYKNNKFKEHEQRRANQEFSIYEQEKWNVKTRKAFQFKTKTLK